MKDYLNNILKLYNWEKVSELDIGTIKSGKPRAYKRRLTSELKNQSNANQFVLRSIKKDGKRDNAYLIRGTSMDANDLFEIIQDVIPGDFDGKIIINKEKNLLFQDIYQVFPMMGKGKENYVTFRPLKIDSLPMISGYL